jgi:hypothetical protein
MADEASLVLPDECVMERKGREEISHCRYKMFELRSISRAGFLVVYYGWNQQRCDLAD